jgi:hemoglobin/transferrin/lactoferrin receptor protein
MARSGPRSALVAAALLLPGATALAQTPPPETPPATPPAANPATPPAANPATPPAETPATPPAAMPGAPPSAATRLDAVTTFGTRTPTVAGDSAAPVTVIGREEILERGVLSPIGLLRDVPGVEISGIPRTTAMQPLIRGLGDERIVFRIDGARNNFNAGHRGRAFIDPELLRQVEVLRGPGSVLYGSGAMGGAISLRTLEPADLLPLDSPHPVGGFMRVGFQSLGSGWLGSGGAAVRIDEWSALAAVSGMNHGQFRDPYDTIIPYSADSAVTLLGRLQWRPGGHLFDLSAMRYENDHAIPIAANTATVTSPTDRTTLQEVLSARWSWSDPSLPLLAPQLVLYRNRVNLEEQRLTGTRALDSTDLVTTGLDLQNTSRFALFGWDAHVLTIGTEIYRDEQTGRSDGVPRPQFPSASQSVTGLFAQDEITIGAFSLVAAVRWDGFRQETDDGTNDDSFDHVSPKVSLAYHVTDWLQPYVSYAQAFRAPSLTELYVGGQHFPGNAFVPNPNLKPETATNWEAGFNLRFRDVLREGDRLRARVTFFNNEIDDYIEQIVLARTTISRNVGRARIQGAEAEVQYDAGTWFAGLSATALRGDNLTDDEPLASMPAARLALNGGYRFLEDGLTIGARWLLVAAQDRNPNISGVAQETSGYGLLDLYASWVPTFAPNLRIDVGLDNAFDHAYRRSTWNSNPPPPYYEVGRNIRGTLRLSF